MLFSGQTHTSFRLTKGNETCPRMLISGNNPPIPPLEAVSQCPFCHCERPQGAWQSFYFQYVMRLLQSLCSLAMTLRHSLLEKGGKGGFEGISGQKIFPYIVCLLVIISGCAGYYAKKADVHNKLGIEYVVKKDYDKAIDEFNEAIELNPKKIEIYYNLGVVYTYKDETSKEGEEAYLKAVEYSDNASDSGHKRVLPYAYYNLACIYALRGDKDKAFAYLEKAASFGSVVYHSMQRDKEMDSLRDDPRFKELLDRARKDGK